MSDSCLFVGKPQTHQCVVNLDVMLLGIFGGDVLTNVRFEAIRFVALIRLYCSLIGLLIYKNTPFQTRALWF